MDNSDIFLTQWQNEQLEGLTESGVQCLLNSWKSLNVLKSIDEISDVYCNATWDSLYCWPPTKAGLTITRPCSEVMKDSQDFEPHSLGIITGNAIRICSENGTWLWGNWTNYNECLENLKDPVTPIGSNAVVVDAVRYILFIGSILSFVSLTTSLFIFYYFKCLRCDRITVHIHLMLSLALRFILLIFVTEPFIFQRTDNYRRVDWVCKTVLSLLMYATVASINWMFIQGHYLHGRLTTNVFDRGTPFKIYHFIGWILPLILIIVWAYIMETYHPVHCWSKFSEQHYIWILVGPMIFALFVNLIFLVNIMRILLTKIQRANRSNDATQFRRAVKATAILFPLLGINNLLFVYNPGGGYENVYMIANTVLQSSQGIFVSLLYCFISNDVRDAIRREYRRFSARRSANSIRRTQSRKKNWSGVSSTSLMTMTPKSRSSIHNNSQNNYSNNSKNRGMRANSQKSGRVNILITIGDGRDNVIGRSGTPSPDLGLNYLTVDSMSRSEINSGASDMELNESNCPCSNDKCTLHHPPTLIPLQAIN